MWFSVVCTLIDNASLLFSQTLFSYCFCMLREFPFVFVFPLPFPFVFPFPSVFENGGKF